ncbi:ATP-binding protein [Streptomyces sp. NPDC052644]
MTTTPAAITGDPPAATDPPTCPGFEIAFEPAAQRARQARRIARAYLPLWGLAGLADTAVLVVSELVTNAVQHGTGTIGLRVRPYAAELLIEVSDGNPTPPRPRHAGDDEEDGRGLLLVDAFAARWGVSEDGTTTWCTLALPGGRP